MIMTFVLMGLISILLTALAVFTVFYTVKFCIKFIELVKVVRREPECKPPLSSLSVVKGTGTNGKVINLEDYRKRK